MRKLLFLIFALLLGVSAPAQACNPVGASFMSNAFVSNGFVSNAFVPSFAFSQSVPLVGFNAVPTVGFGNNVVVGRRGTVAVQSGIGTGFSNNVVVNQRRGVLGGRRRGASVVSQQGAFGSNIVVR